jgi:Flp pilus assembly protein TadB
MYIPRKLAGTFIILCLLSLTTAAGISAYYFSGTVAFFFVLSALITTLVINWVGSEPKQSQSHRKVEKMLRNLDDNSLDLLRSRLMEPDDKVVYGSMAELVQSGKRKNELHDL